MLMLCFSIGRFLKNWLKESVGFLVAIKEALENPVEILMDNNPKQALEM